MADKKFTQKVGYQDALDFDPANGILKYGTYEVFAKDVGVEPKVKKVTLDDYITSVTKPKNSIMGMASQSFINPINDSQRNRYRSEFQEYMDSFFGGGAGAIGKPSLSSRQFSLDTFHNKSAPDVFGLNETLNTGMIGQADGVKKQQNNFTSVNAAKKLGNDEYEIYSYDIPKDQNKGYDIINKINDRALQLNRVTRDDALTAQNTQDAANRRQGRASTVINS